ncbi:asparaginase [Halovenus sp. WSH3]|uniref:Plant-type L-asparaginase n=1 Tax=Halovenus carboxidivorans TaxID=2692199 RepID=A0A6B0T2N4_9EURY|nr:isoaspartyl peptidase/L-asparaginase [Halovenus carboxidivorans]MXR50496.1 asparaginase [Halovenus carboxidivorans]
MHLLAHGGAGSRPGEPTQRQAVLDRAAAAGVDPDSPAEAVVAAVTVLESDPRFNAGVGSAVQSDGVIRTDGGFMLDDGTTGAACSMPGVERAIEVARLVAEETPHILLSGDHAVEFARAHGVETDRDLWCDRTRDRWADLSDRSGAGVRDQLDWVREQFGGTDTVGAVATDGDRLAAATSTGGRWAALAGRVGDVPQVGSGFYASTEAAVSATGAGEAIARFGLARRVANAIDDGDDPQTATDRLIRAFGSETGEQAGVIAVDSAGRMGSAFNSEAMQTASARER